MMKSLKSKCLVYK